jgi:hypothetical protein
MNIVEKVIPVAKSFTPDVLRVIRGGTYVGDNRKARLEHDFTPRPFSKVWTETLRHEMSLLGI